MVYTRSETSLEKARSIRAFLLCNQPSVKFSSSEDFAFNFQLLNYQFTHLPIFRNGHAAVITTETNRRAASCTTPYLFVSIPEVKQLAPFPLLDERKLRVASEQNTLPFPAIGSATT